MTPAEINAKWKVLQVQLAKDFDTDLPDMKVMLFLIGVQELGQPVRKFSKDQKVDLLHVAICRLLEPFGYYQYEGTDQDGWPHYSPTELLPQLNPAQQHHLMKRAIVEYFRPEKPINAE